MSLDEIQEKINLTTLNENVKWHLQPACAIQNEGLHEGFQCASLPSNEALLQTIRHERPPMQLDHNSLLPLIFRATDRGKALF
ncbi:unnamed protein product [Rotaria sp. Silwood1]|nr:unnamed protein product [Rotaria sp. Silwood1]CAF1359326.1 unnamed protein product [Rotaria sp. Silwood1]